MQDEGLVLASADLARNAREPWQKFMTELDAHAKRLGYAMIHAGNDSIHTSQGVAREAEYLVKLFRGCIEDAEKLKAKRA